ncbi:Callose synthase [Trichinella pseudospiralis]
MEILFISLKETSLFAVKVSLKHCISISLNMIASLAKRKREAKVVIILETEKHFDTTGSGDIILPSLKIKLPSSQPHQFKAHNVI